MQKSPWFRQSWLLLQWFMHSLAELTIASMGGDGGGDGTSVVHLLLMHLLQEVPSLHVESTEQSLLQNSAGDRTETEVSDCRTVSRRARPQEERIRSENRTDLIIRSNLTRVEEEPQPRS